VRWLLSQTGKTSCRFFISLYFFTKNGQTMDSTVKTKKSKLMGFSTKISILPFERIKARRRFDAELGLQAAKMLVNLITTKDLTLLQAVMNASLTVRDSVATLTT